jgi:hypothetical protein
LFHAYKDLITRDQYKIHIDLLHQYLGYKENNWTKIEQAFQWLQSTLVCWNIFGQAGLSFEDKSWIRVQYIVYVSWNKDTREFIYSFNKHLAEKLFLP